MKKILFFLGLIMLIALGGFSCASYYWSSSEYEIHRAFVHSFTGGQYGHYYKAHSVNVRCVRDF
jgi:hypothetical protein